LTAQYSKTIIVNNGGGNEPPTQPTNESPSNNATDISVNTNLSWTCTDPEGDVLDYNIYFGTSSNPPKVEEYYTSTTYDPGDLEENTTYYWQIKAYEVDNNTNYSESPIWVFTTGEGGGGGGGEPCPDTPTVTDADGNIYNTVQIGDQCWMRENLNMGTRIDISQEMINNSIIEKYCYNDDDTYCETYGGLYQWEELMQYTTNQGTQGICPSGWHIPTYDDFEMLRDYVGGWPNGGALKEVGFSHWNQPNQGATNSTGFTALPGGQAYKSSGGTGFVDIGESANFWSSTESNTTYLSPYLLNVNTGPQVSNSYFYGKSHGMSVRCLKD